ncbi:MAG: 3-phosphoshikimate 1-carboxyvinyltransferase [Candidatus Omnitrophica bacterium]|nr:3-phosphoshikimate 1-carboxyvinyltransferase [Candidatus Omnitrophota bacterium]
MILKVKSTEALKGEAYLPPSKSYSIRAFIIAACGGTSKIICPSDCDDARVAMTVARSLGAKIKKVGDNDWFVQADSSAVPARVINVKESGTVLRFLLPLLGLHKQKVVVKGEGTLKGRPNYHLTKVLRAHGVDIHGHGPKESVPLRVSGGNFDPGNIVIDGTLSSQFISALLIACPRLANNTKIFVEGKKIVSTDYIAMTRQVLKLCGINIIKVNARRYNIPGRQKFKGLRRFHVPSDYGLAAFLMAAGALQKSNITLRGCFDDSFIQADGWIFAFLKRMGVKLQKTSRSIKIKGPFQLKGGDFSLQSCPDLVPVMAVLGLFAKGKTRLYNIRHARAKESDRISDLRKELLKIGAKVKETKNELIVYPQDNYKENVLINPHHDHRLAMAFSVLGTKIGVAIKDIECVNKSYPGFVKDFSRIGAVVKKQLK